MVGHTYHLEIVTPTSTLFNGTVNSATLPGMVSPFQVLINHAPIVSALDVGTILVEDDAGKKYIFATSGGFAELRRNNLTVTVESAEPADTIDAGRAQQAADRATERIHQARAEHDHSIDLTRAEAALARAANRLRVISRLS